MNALDFLVIEILVGTLAAPGLLVWRLGRHKRRRIGWAESILWAPSFQRVVPAASYCDAARSPSRDRSTGTGPVAVLRLTWTMACT